MRAPKPFIAHVALAVLTLGGAVPAMAEQFTTAEEVKPMLDITRDHWVSLRERGAEDQLLFTQVIAWRCGLDAIAYKVNDRERRVLEVEPCYEGETRPNGIKGDGFLPYVTFPLGMVEEVRVWLDYDDGSSDSETYRRDAILSR